MHASDAADRLHSPPTADWLTSREAASRLGVSVSTLYTYASRGLLHPQPAAGRTRAKRYAREQVERLARRHAAAREPRRVAGAALDFGLPVLASGVSLIEDGRLFYAGVDAGQLAERADLAEVAALLWQQPVTPTALPPLSAATRRALAQGLALPMPQRLVLGLSQIATDAAMAQAPPWAWPQALLAAAVGHVVRDARPLHQQLQQAWGLPQAAADGLRRALVLCADHELNASSFTARCVASTGATPPAVLGAALAALSGPRHGGMTFEVRALWPTLMDRAARSSTLLRWLQARPDLPGFGHPLYPEGDPRARHLLAQLPRDARRSRVIAAVQQARGLAPSVDFALVALCEALRAPPGAAYALFAIGRSVGWLAHAFEQQRSGQLIRPRAAYVGPVPAEPVAAPQGSVLRRRPDP